MNEEPPSQIYSQMYSTTNFTSEFFGNFIDNSHIDSDASYHSQNSSLMQSEENNNGDFSVNEGKLKQFHMQNLIYLSQTLIKRLMIHRWINEKNRLKSIQKRTPNHLTKVILKVFYSLSIKLQVKYSHAFRKMQKLYQQSKDNAEPAPMAMKSKSCNEFYAKNEAVDNKKMRSKAKIDAAGKIGELIVSLQSKYNQQIEQCRLFLDILQQRSKIISSLQSMSGIVDQINYELVSSGWSSIRNRINFFQKIQILEGTLNLLIHLKMRQTFWSITVQKQSLQYNDISNIQENKYRKQSFKMNTSTQSLKIQKELLDQIPVIDCKNQPEHQNQIESIKESNRSFKKRDNQVIDRNDPRNLKFSKDVKRKTVPTQHTHIIQQDLDEQNETVSQQNYQFIPMTSQTSQIKPQMEDLSMVRRNSATMNTSIYQSKSILKKIYSPIEFNPERSCKVATALGEDNLPLILNEGEINKQFQNNNKIFKTKAIKHEQFRKQFTDFNDLFTVREILSFYHGMRVGQSPKKGISLAKIKQKVNMKTQEEYYCRPKLQTEPQEHEEEHIYVSETNLDHSSSRNSRKGGLQHTFNSIANNSQNRSRHYSRDKSRKAEFRIPSQLPKNFDYYVDKSLKRQAKIQKTTSSELRLHVDGESKRKSVCSKSRKKLLFNVVKSGSNRISAEHQERKKTSIEAEGNKLMTARPKVELNSKKSIKQPKPIKQSQSPQSNCEYFMTFRDPPKKKIKKGILKNDM